jgi:hypothetical protein
LLGGLFYQFVHRAAVDFYNINDYPYKEVFLLLVPIFIVQVVGKSKANKLWEK